MLNIEKKPSLRISPNVYGRTSVRNKVKYLIDPKGGGSDMGVPERVVLTRWRMRQFTNHKFSGDKLSSTLWRAVAAVYGKNAAKICKLSKEQLEEIKVIQSQSEEERNYLKLPASSIMFALFFICGPKRLQILIDKHTSKEHEGRSGVPDLFLFAASTVTGKPSIARFVEVKKPGEKISQDQIDEIELLNSMGLHARVIRLVEMPRAKVKKNFRAC
jgi:hypothetical protein